MSTCVIAFLLHIQIPVYFGYYLSLSEMPWLNASNYCSKYCGSELISFHSQDEYETVLETIKLNIYIHDDIWIGLYRYSNLTEFLWSDNTTFNFGNDTSGSIYPWNSDTPGIDRCVKLRPDRNFTWDDSECSHRRHFMCHTCDGVLTKYISRSVSLNFTDAIVECSLQFGTTIGSIHSEYDNQEAQLLAKERGLTHWIGLYDKYGTLNFTWLDATTFDYGSNYTVEAGIWPWGQGDPDTVSAQQHCVNLRQSQHYTWNDDDCNKTKQVLCNMPSELCNSDEWFLMNVPGRDVNITSDSDEPICEFIYEDLLFDDPDGPIFTLKTKQFLMPTHWLTPLVIEYMFNMNLPATASTGYGPDGGIVIFYNNQCTQYVRIGIHALSQTVQLITEPLVSETAKSLSLAECALNYQLDVYYRLTVEIYDGVHYIVKINDCTFINHTLPINITDTKLSGAIGIYGNDAIINSKHLFVTGQPYYIYDTYWYNECKVTAQPTTSNPTINPSNHPTIQPTSDPTVNPTFDPTQVPTMEPTINPTAIPTFDPTVNPTNPSQDPTLDPTMNPTTDPTNPSEETTYDTTAYIQTSNTDTSIVPTFNPTEIPSMNSVGDTIYGIKIKFSFDYVIVNATIPQNIIENELINITTKLIQNEIKDIDCELTDDYYNITVFITVNGTTTTAVILVSVYVCNEEERAKLYANIYNNTELQTNMINTIRNETVLIIEEISVNFDVDKISTIKSDEFTTSQFFYSSTTFQNEIGEKDNDNDTTLIMIIIAICILCCVIAVIAYICVMAKNSDKLIEIQKRLTTELVPGVRRMNTKGALQIDLHEDGDSNEDDIAISDDSDNNDKDMNMDNIGEDGANDGDIIIHGDTVTIGNDGDIETTKGNNVYDNNNDIVTAGNTLDVAQNVKNDMVIHGDDENVTAGENDDINDIDDKKKLKQWLSEKCGLSEYYDVFIENGYESLNVVQEIEDLSYFQEIGIHSVDHQTKIFQEIKKLRAKNTIN